MKKLRCGLDWEGRYNGKPNHKRAKRIYNELHKVSNGSQTIGLENMDYVFRFNDIYKILLPEEKEEIDSYISQLKSKSK